MNGTGQRVHRMEESAEGQCTIDSRVEGTVNGTGQRVHRTQCTIDSGVEGTVKGTGQRVHRMDESVTVPWSR